MLIRSACLVMSTSVLKALPGKFDIKRHSPSILYLFDTNILLQILKDHINGFVDIIYRCSLEKETLNLDIF